MEGNEFWQDAGLAVFVLLGIAAVVWIGSMIWVYRDARERGLGGIASLLVTALVGFTAWPLTVLGWVILRPKERAHA